MLRLSDVHQKLLDLKLHSLTVVAYLDDEHRDVRLLSRSLDELRDLVRDIAGKANFDPNQPRVPPGNPDGGQWSGGGGSSQSRLQTGRSSATTPPPKKPLRVTIRPKPNASPNPRFGIGHNGGPPLEDLSQLPPEPPPVRGPFLVIAKKAAAWVAKRVLLGASPVGAALLVIEAAYWLYTEWDHIISFADPARSLDELRQRAMNPQPGYEIHHIDEQKFARDGIEPWSWTDSPENRVLIPTWQHHRITGHYARINDLTGCSLRQQLTKLDRATRFEIGLKVLRVRENAHG